MLADDDPDDVLIFKELIGEIFKERPTGYLLAVASDGIELMRVMEATTVLPTLIFIDINMPGKDGLECLREIKGNKRYKNISVIMLSTSSFHLHIRTAYERGADLYIVKSPDLDKMKRDIITSIFMKPDFNGLINGVPRY